MWMGEEELSAISEKHTSPGVATLPDESGATWHQTKELKADR
jgi:hypothetical protein